VYIDLILNLSQNGTGFLFYNCDVKVFLFIFQELFILHRISAERFIHFLDLGQLFRRTDKAGSMICRHFQFPPSAIRTVNIWESPKG